MEISLPTLLTIIFLILKLIGTIAWSWWWVLSPLWIATGLALGFWAIIGIVALAAGSRRRRVRR